MYVCIFEYIHTRIYIIIDLYVYIYIYIYISLYIYIYIVVYTHSFHPKIYINHYVHGYGST